MKHTTIAAICLFLIAAFRVPLAGQTDTFLLIHRVDSLIKESRSLASRQKFDQALALTGLADSLTLAEVGEGSVLYGSCCFNRGRIHYMMRNFSEAEKWYIQSRDIREEALGREHAEYAWSLNNLAVLYVDMMRFQEAERYHLEAMAVREKVRGRDHPEYAVSLNNIGLLYDKSGQSDKAEIYYLQAKKVRASTLGDRHPEYAQSINNLANLYAARGEYEKAEEYYKEAISIREDIFGTMHPEYAQSVNNLAGIYWKKGQFTKAETLQLEAKRVQEQTLGLKHPEYASSLSNLASLYTVTGQYEEAETLYTEALSIQKEALGTHHPDCAKSLNNLASLYETIGQFDKAESFLRDAKTIREASFGTQHPEYVRSLNNLAVLYLNKKDYTLAETIFQEVNALLKQNPGMDDVLSGGNLMNMAVLYYELGQFEKAIEYCRSAKDIWETVLGKLHPDYALCVHNLACFYQRANRFDEAGTYFLEAGDIWKRVVGTSHPDYALHMSNLSSYYAQLGQYEKAEILMDSTMENVHARLGQAVRYSSEKDMQDILQKESTLLSRVPSYALSGYFSPRMAKLAYDDALFQKGFLQSVARRINLLIKTTSKVDSNVTELKTCRFQLSAQYSKPIAERKYVKELEDKANRLEGQLARMISGYAEDMRPIRWREVQQSLDSREAAIEFIRFPVLFPNNTDSIMYAALILRPDASTPAFVPLCEEGSIDSLLLFSAERREAYVNQLYQVSGRGFQKVSGKTRSLYQLLWQPLERHLAGIETIYFANAGLMHRINMAAVTVGGDSTIADRYRLVSVVSTRTLAQSSGSKKTGTRAILFGGIEYDVDSLALPVSGSSQDSTLYAVRGLGRLQKLAYQHTRVQQWAYLPHTAKELALVMNEIKSTDIHPLTFSGRQAREATFYTEASSVTSPPRVIHVATHGFFLKDPDLQVGDPMRAHLPSSGPALARSGLLLANSNYAWNTGQPPPSELHDGILTAFEISQLQLPYTELVVLSACDTGLGDIQGNEGVYGLQRAFKIAGVKYLIMTLWQIPDQETSAFMQAFYNNWLHKRLSISKAFRVTQQQMRERFINPYSWAGFVLLE